MATVCYKEDKIKEMVTHLLFIYTKPRVTMKTIIYFIETIIMAFLDLFKSPEKINHRKTLEDWEIYQRDLYEMFRHMYYSQLQQDIDDIGVEEYILSKPVHWENACIYTDDHNDVLSFFRHKATIIKNAHGHGYDFKFNINPNIERKIDENLDAAYHLIQVLVNEGPMYPSTILKVRVYERYTEYQRSVHLIEYAPYPFEDVIYDSLIEDEE
jgi:hypothetical protein